jgi:hypothetical protein
VRLALTAPIKHGKIKNTARSKSRLDNTGGRMAFWRKYLTIVGLSLIAFGVYITFCKNTPLFAPFGNLIDPIFWPDGTVTEGTRNFKGFIYSFSGVYVLLWGMNFLFISKYALIPGNRWAWNCLVSSTIIWFITMVPFSIYYRVYYNVIGDVLFFITVAIPMIRIRKYIYS